MKYGYVRSKQQSGYSIERQIKALKKHNLDEIVVESSGEDLEALIGKLQAGDTIYVESAEILTRNTYKMLEILDSVSEKGSTLSINGKPFKLPTIYEMLKDM